jgi:predicted DNA-binding transcriptional regulator YafY
VLARELEVSVRTARRDLEALAGAGLPVYAQPGRGGGWSLLGGARTDLSGLTAAETRALFLLAGPGAAMAPESRGALRKLVGALPETFRAEAQAAASAVVLDATSWGGAASPSPPHLESLQRAVIERRQIPGAGHQVPRGALVDQAEGVDDPRRLVAPPVHVVEDRCANGGAPTWRSCRRPGTASS